MKTIISILLMILFSCQNTKQNHSQSIIQYPQQDKKTEYFKNSLELFTFEIESISYDPYRGPSKVFGKAFIADGKVWSVKHLFGPYMTNDDTKKLGTSPLHGLTICKNEHKKGDFLFYKTTKRGIINLVILEDKDKILFTSLDQEMKHGDSGSPVLCKEHSHVVGLVSSLWIKHKDVRIAGNISKFPEESNPPSSGK